MSNPETISSSIQPVNSTWRAAVELGAQRVVVELSSNSEGVCSCRLRFDEADGAIPDLADAVQDLPCPTLSRAVRQLQEYFAGQRRTFDLPLAPERGTPFQRQVWEAASQIPFGQTRSYWWVAVRAGNPYATRAVGSALGANPLPLLVPCHRVVRADGAIGGFTPDPSLKVLLLAHEGGFECGDPEADSPEFQSRQPA